MSSLSHPSGPEPERVYWFRRGVVAVAVVATVALAAWVLSMLLGSSGTTASAEPPQNDPTLVSDTPTSPAASATSPAASATSPAASAGSPTPGPSSASASAGSPTSPSRPASHSPSPSPTRTTPAAPLVCAAADVALKVSGDASIKSGSHTTISVSFTNHGSATCRLDFAKTPMTLKIYSGTDRIWTSDDCTSWVASGVKTLATSKSYTFKEEWTTLRSAPGCKLRDIYLQPGTYVATATIPGGQPAQLVMKLHA